MDNKERISLSGKHVSYCANDNKHLSPWNVKDWIRWDRVADHYHYHCDECGKLNSNWEAWGWILQYNSPLSKAHCHPIYSYWAGKITWMCLRLPLCNQMWRMKTYWKKNKNRRTLWRCVEMYFWPCLLLCFRRESCNEGEGDPPLYVNVNMFSGEIMNTWIDSLQAFFPGLQVRLLHFQLCVNM